MKHIKIKPSDTRVDHAYQRDLDETRARVIAVAFSPELVGVPVVSRRPDGSLVRIDGQHRLAAAIMAGLGEEAILMEVHDGLSVEAEAQLFLRLNGSRKAVGAVDKFRARVVANEPTAVEIKGILAKHGCKITKAPQRNGVLAVEAVERAYHDGVLGNVVRTLKAWLDGDSSAFEGEIVKAAAGLFLAHPDADPMYLAKRMETFPPSKVLARIRREKLDEGWTSKKEAAASVLIDIYNHRTHASKRLGSKLKAVA